VTLTTTLMPLMNRSVLNPGKAYRVTLFRGLEVAFMTRLNGNVVMQLSRPVPSEPSSTEMTTCLKAIQVVEPDKYPVTKHSLSDRNFLLVEFTPPERTI
jgi:hypothetical protein